MNDPAVVWADEPTGNLDSDSATDILELIERLNQQNGQTFVLVTHDARVAERAQRILRMRDGVIESDERPTRTDGSASTSFNGYNGPSPFPRAPWIH